MTEVNVTEAVAKANEQQKDVKTAIVTLARAQGVKVTFRGLTTRVKLADGTSGKAKCDPTDTYSALVGYEYAISRAQYRAAEKQAVVKKRQVRT